MYDRPDTEVLFKMTGQPGDLVRIVPTSDPHNWYQGRILTVFVTDPGLPLAIQIKPTRLPAGEPTKTQTIPWAVVESLAIIEFASNEAEETES